METEQAKVKQQVRERYTAAVSDESGCCSTTCCGASKKNQVIPADRVAATSGYSAEQLNSLPADAVQNSFGCGNPVAFADVKPGQTVIDIGSGAGIDCLLASQKVGPQGKVIGIDMTPIMIEKARKNAEKAEAMNVEFRMGEAEKMPVESGSVDWIVSNCVINLSPDKPSVFKEAFRVLRENGKLSVSDIMVEKLPWFLRRSSVLYTSCVAGAIPEKQYLDGLRQAGFSDIRVTDRIVYDREQVLGFVGEVKFFGTMLKKFPRLMTSFLDRFIVGKVWSSRVVATKATL